MKWGYGLVDSHAIDDTRDHPEGVYRTECGHLLLRLVTTLRDTPDGAPCPSCALQLVIGAVIDRRGD